MIGMGLHLKSPRFSNDTNVRNDSFFHTGDQGRRNVGRAGGGRKKVEGNAILRRTKRSLPNIRPVTRRGAGAWSPLKKFRPSLEKCVEHSLKNVGPSQ